MNGQSNGSMLMARNNRRLRGVAFFVGSCLLAGTGASAATLPAGRPAPCRESIPALYARVSPAVVSITAASVDPYDTQSRMERQAGSGVIVDASGLILTNSHVVFGHPVITVTLDGGANLPAQIVGADPLFEIALIPFPSAATSSQRSTAGPSATRMRSRRRSAR
jgi:S1-C subfamily serine protease